MERTEILELMTNLKRYSSTTCVPPEPDGVDGPPHGIDCAKVGRQEHQRTGAIH
jgi:hypothetical protein